MSTFSQSIITSIVLVTFVFGLFIVFAILRIKRSSKELSTTGKSKAYRLLRRVDLVFSSIFLIAMITIYLLFISKIGH